MIEESKDKIKIYSSTNNTELKLKIVIFMLCGILGIYLYFITQTHNLFFLIVSFFMIILIYRCFKKMKKKYMPVLEAEITKESIKFYTKKQVVEFKYDNLKNVSYCDDGTSSNEIFVNYYDDNQKLNTELFYITGCDKMKFADIVNNIKYSDKKEINIINDINKIETIHNNGENINKKECLNELLKNGETLKVLFLGKARLLKRIGENNYSFPRSSEFYFIDENGNELYLYLQDLDIDYKELKVQKVYTIEYNKKYKNYTLKSAEQHFNKHIFEKAKNKLEYKNTLLFEDMQIHREIEYEQKLFKLSKIFIYSFLLDFLLLFKYPEITIIIFLTGLVLTLNSFFNIRNKCKKYYNNN